MTEDLDPVGRLLALTGADCQNMIKFPMGARP